jgi:hypothetical protein
MIGVMRFRMARGGRRFPATVVIVTSLDVITTILILTVANLHKIGVTPSQVCALERRGPVRP